MGDAPTFLTQTLRPGLTWLASVAGPVPPTSEEAQVLLLAIAGQESGWQNIAQEGGGPGRGPWQFEPETCRELMFNPASEAAHTKVCMALGIVPSRAYGAILSEPNLAVAFARLDLWCDPHPLPALGDQDGAWEYYLRCWRPGIPRPDDWGANYHAALAAITQGAT